MIVEKRPFDEVIFYPESDQEKDLLGSDKVEATRYDIFYAHLFKAAISLYFIDRERYNRFMEKNKKKIKLYRTLMVIGDYLYYSHQDRVLKFSGLPYPRKKRLTKQRY